MIDLDQLLAELDETKNINNDYDRFIAIKDHLSISTLQRIFNLPYLKAKKIIDDLVECGAIEKETYKLLSIHKYNDYLRQHSIVKYKCIDDFTPNIFDFIKNHLIKDVCYVTKLDKVFDTNLSIMPFEDRKEKIELMLQSESNTNLIKYLTYSYLAKVYRNSDNLYEQNKLSLIDKIFKD